MALNGKMSSVWRFTQTLATPENYDDARATPTIDTELALTNGTADGSADLIFTDRRSIALSSSETLDLAGGLTDVFGTTLTFVEIVGIKVKNRETTATRVLRIGPNSTNGFLGPFVDATDRLALGPGSSFEIWRDSGWAVTAGTADLLFFQNTDGAGALIYDVMIVGRSA